MKAITVNQSNIVKYELKTIDKLFNFLSDLGIKPLVISAERSNVGYNYHYHVMAEDYDKEIEKQLWINAIYNDDVINPLAYYDYIIKEGNFKLFNGYDPVYIPKPKNQYEQMLNDIYINDVSMQELRIKYPVLFVRHYNTICKMYNINN